MPITFWNTLAVQDIERARAFYSALGFAVRDMPGGAGGITVHPDASAMICLFTREVFGGLIPGDVCDTTRAQEIIQSVSADTRDGVDELIRKAEAAGGKIIGKPRAEPWGYVAGFTDPDGHLWSVLWLAQQGPAK